MTMAKRSLYSAEKTDVELNTQKKKKQKKEERQKKKTTQIRIPDDMIEEILLELPPKSLLRFRSLSKSWKDTISSSIFKRAHLQRSKNKPPSIVSPRQEFYFMVNETAQLTPVERLKVRPILTGKCKVLFESGCDGFLLLSTDDGALPRTPPIPPPRIILILLNPSIRKHKILTMPNIRNAHVRFGIGYDPSIDDYKILKLVRGIKKNRSYRECEVLTLKSNLWRPLSFDLPCSINADTRPVTVRGVMYWLAWLQKRPIIVCFDLANETFRMQLRPVGYRRIYGLTEHHGKLGCFCQNPHPSGFGFEPFDLCLLEDQTWVRFITIPNPFISRENFLLQQDNEMVKKMCGSLSSALSIYRAASLISFD